MSDTMIISTTVPELLKEVRVSCNIIHFRSLEKINFFGTYDPKTTSLKRVIEGCFDNYDCKNQKQDIDQKNIDIFSVELNQSLYDLDLNSLMSELGFSQKTKFILRRSECDRFKTSADVNLDDRLQALLSMKNTHQIFCKDMFGRLHCLDVKQNFTLGDVKILINHNNNIPIDQQRIIFRGTQLDDDNYTLDQYNIPPLGTLHLVLRLRGGMYHETSGRCGNYGDLESNIFAIKADRIDLDHN